LLFEVIKLLFEVMFNDILVPSNDMDRKIFANGYHLILLPVIFFGLIPVPVIFFGLIPVPVIFFGLVTVFFLVLFQYL
jgi:hypothetical protein